MESSSEDSGRLQRQVTELQRKNSELTLSADNLNTVVKKLKADKTELETKIRSLEEESENHGRDKDQLEKVQKTVKDLRVSDQRIALDCEITSQWHLILH